MHIFIITDIWIVCIDFPFDHRFLPFTARNNQTNKKDHKESPVAKIVDGAEEPKFVQEQVWSCYCALVFRSVCVTYLSDGCRVIALWWVCCGQWGLQQVFLAAVHDVLWGQTVDHVAGVEDDEEEDHAEEEESLRSGSLRPDLIQPYPEEPNPHVTNPSHGGEDKVHGDDGDQNIVQWENRLQRQQ